MTNINRENSTTAVTIKKFYGHPKEDFFIWKIRVEIRLKGKELWMNIIGQNVSARDKDVAYSAIVSALNEDPLLLCIK